MQLLLACGCEVERTPAAKRKQAAKKDGSALSKALKPPSVRPSSNVLEESPSHNSQMFRLIRSDVVIGPIKTSSIALAECNRTGSRIL